MHNVQKVKLFCYQLTIAPSLRQGYLALSSPSWFSLIVPSVVGNSGWSSIPQMYCRQQRARP